MRISVVIATYNRPHDLEMCLDSVLAQTVLPLEILIVDNDLGNPVDGLVRERRPDFADRGAVLRYLPSSKNSLTAARNLGGKQTSGDIVLFLDDDVVLDKDYIHEILGVYAANPNILGVQGYIVPDQAQRMRNSVYRLFYWYHLERNRCRALPSVSATYPLALDGVMPCEWLSGANHSYRRSVLDEFDYDEQLIKYSDGEDLKFSYRVFCRYPGSLFITPFAKLVHNTSIEGRALGRELVYMQEIYGLYLFFKLFAPTLKNRLIYLWSRVGRLILILVSAMIKQTPGSIAELRHRVSAYYICLRRSGEIKRGDLEFFNSTLGADTTGSA